MSEGIRMPLQLTQQPLLMKRLSRPPGHSAVLRLRIYRRPQPKRRLGPSPCP